MGKKNEITVDLVDAAEALDILETLRGPVEIALAALDDATENEGKMGANARLLLGELPGMWDDAINVLERLSEEIHSCLSLGLKVPL